MNIKKKINFQLSLTSMMLILVAILSIAFFFIIQVESKKAGIGYADKFFTEVSHTVVDKTDDIFKTVANLADNAYEMPMFKMVPVGDGLDFEGLGYIFQNLTFYPHIYSIFIGYDDGKFIQVIATRGDHEILENFKAPDETLFIVRSITYQNMKDKRVKKEYYSFLDKSGKKLASRVLDNPTYDPRNRPWFKVAKLDNKTSFTGIYLFDSFKTYGSSAFRHLDDGMSVFGVDLRLDQISAFLEEKEISQNSSIFLFNEENYIIADSIGPHSIKSNHIEEVNQPDSKSHRNLQLLKFIQSGEMEKFIDSTQVLEFEDNEYIVRMAYVCDEYDLKLTVATLAPVSDFTGLIQTMQKRTVELILIIILIFVPISVYTAKRISYSIEQLSYQAKRIQEYNFDEPEATASVINEISILIDSFALMRGTVRKKTVEINDLLHSIIKLLAGAIDAKSPYTGGHCFRVPMIANMLIQAVSDTEDGVLADFSFNSEDEKEEFNIAAWLHDCGKIITPEYVVDKATKLETIYNRIHEIRMRFEVLLRDADIEYYQKLIEGKIPEIELAEKLKLLKDVLVEEFNFVAKCNIGCELMSADDIERLQNIGKHEWTRHLDDSLGVSEEEKKRLDKRAKQTLPVVEKLLSDKVEHIVERGLVSPFGDNSYNFKMDIPEKLYNKGEIYNLSILKGTLTAEERFKINEHITQTIMMLESLPFPENMKNVPDYAGAHHETMIGTGYPRKMRKEELSVPARVIAIADIFEALTASDRPYMKAKKLSTALKIMSFMRNDSHIDADLFEVFLKSGVYHEYAQEYLAPDQVDEVNIEDYL